MSPALSVSTNVEQIAITLGLLISDFNKTIFHIMQDPNSIILTADLHIKFPANVFDVVRKVNVSTVI